MGLDLAIPQTPKTGLMWDYKLINRLPVQSLLQYEVDSYPNAKLNTWLPEFIRIQTTTIDTNDNPKISNFAQTKFNQSNNTEQFISTLLDYIREQPFHYTLEPPTLSRQNSIDQFWFETRQGFCAHYAGSMVYMLRAVGIPARMVGGYQGGEINPLTGHLVVRQYHAHAWVEYWSSGKGWQRVDPTAAVAPSRIHESLSAALPENELDALSAFTNVRLNGIAGLQKLMFLFESIEHRWNLFVIGYNSERQTDFLQKLLGNVTTTKIACALLSIMFVAVTLLNSNRNRHQHPVIKLFQRFSNRLLKKGFERNPHETPTQFIQRLADVKNIDVDEYQPITNTLYDLLYNPNSKINDEILSRLKFDLEKLSIKLSYET
jgi:transglutaminase-like putative cysteine protease